MAQRRQKGGTSIAVVAEGRHTHCRGCRMEAQWSPNGRQVIDAFCCKFSRQSGRCFCLPCRWSSYTETGFSGVRRPLSVLAIFLSFKGGTKVAILCKGGISLLSSPPRTPPPLFVEGEVGSGSGQSPIRPPTLVPVVRSRTGRVVKRPKHLNTDFLLY